MTHMSKSTRSYRWTKILACAMAAAALPSPAAAQLDPLLFLKSSQPNVIVMVDVANRMQRDAPTDPSSATNSRLTSNYFDPFIYSASVLGATQQSELGLNASNMNTSYRRRYYGLEYISNSNGDR